MKYNFDVNIIYNEQLSIDDRIKVKISRETAFLFVDEINIFSIYPKYLTKIELADEIEEWIESISWIDEKPTKEKIIQISQIVKSKIGEN